MRILIAIEPRSYGQVIGNAVEKLRPHLEVVVVEPEYLVSEVERVYPDLLFSHLRGPELPVVRVEAWVELSVEPDRPSTMSVDGQIKELINMDLDDLLSIVDEAEKHRKKHCVSSRAKDERTG